MGGYRKLILCAQKAGKRLTRALLDTLSPPAIKSVLVIPVMVGASRGSGAFDFAGRYFLCRKNTAQFLYHGTASRFLDEIKKQGRLLVSVITYISLLMKQRHAKGSKTRIAGYFNRQSTGNGETGLPFWQAENGVWLTSTVAVGFLSGRSCRLGYKNNKFNILRGYIGLISAAHQVM